MSTLAPAAGELPDFDDLRSAAERLQGVAHRTPVMTSSSIDQRCDAQVFFKCENLQRMGAFKFRGAWNTISRLSEAERARGLLAYSSGNHAQAVALCARLFGIEATIVMPDNAPRAKRDATESYGARVVLYDGAAGAREEIAAGLMRERDYTLIPPFDHPHVIAGQGTSALELCEQVPDLDALLVPCGGGGLLSGCALAVRGLQPACHVIGVEPETADDAARSLRSGRIERVERPQTIADGVRTPELGQLPFAIIRQRVHNIRTVPERAIGAAVALAYQRLKLVIEPSGALGLAALLTGAGAGYRRVGVLVSGGNVDIDVFGELVAAGTEL